jgi:ABC-type multidrug transport system ATPase subunit
MPGQTILSSISGRAAAGQVLGIMGPSGSGKSTLLCILSGSRELLGAGSVVTGRVTLGGEARRSALRKVSVHCSI